MTEQEIKEMQEWNAKYKKVISALVGCFSTLAEQVNIYRQADAITGNPSAIIEAFYQTALDGIKKVNAIFAPQDQKE